MISQMQYTVSINNLNGKRRAQKTKHTAVLNFDRNSLYRITMLGYGTADRHSHFYLIRSELHFVYLYSIIWILF